MTLSTQKKERGNDFGIQIDRRDKFTKENTASTIDGLISPRRETCGYSGGENAKPKRGNDEELYICIPCIDHDHHHRVVDLFRLARRQGEWN